MASSATNYGEAYGIQNGKIYHYNEAVQLIGVNAFHSYGAGATDLNRWNLDISREFIGNVQEEPVQGNIIRDNTGAYLYPLQTIVDSNRAANKISILCPFRWNGNDSTLFTGKMPRQSFWWNDYKIKLKEWAIFFKDRPDVWIELWNEPYRYDRTDGYTDSTWLADMNELTGIVRNAGNNHIILVPCAEQGQDESVLIHLGGSFLAGKSNILFDIHAYEKWLLSNNIVDRVNQLSAAQIPVFIGETAPMNAGVLMNPESMLTACYQKGISVCAWVWKYDDSDQDALLNSIGQPNNINNNQWGTLFKTFAAQPRNP